MQFRIKCEERAVVEVSASVYDEVERDKRRESINVELGRMTGRSGPPSCDITRIALLFNTNPPFNSAFSLCLVCCLRLLAGHCVTAHAGKFYVYIYMNICTVRFQSLRLLVKIHRLLLFFLI